MNTAAKKITLARGLKTALAVIACACLAAGTMLVLSSCSAAKKKAETQAAAPAQTVFAVETASVVRGQVRDYLALSGDIVASSTVDAYSDVAGKVTRHFVSVGQRVAKDQALIEVDPSRPGMSLPARYREGPHRRHRNLPAHGDRRHYSPLRAGRPDCPDGGPRTPNLRA